MKTHADVPSVPRDGLRKAGELQNFTGNVWETPDVAVLCKITVNSSVIAALFSLVLCLRFHCLISNSVSLLHPI